MIIQCRKCRTKFRFDESIINADGIWVRCSRCQEVFFQHPPLPPPESSFETTAAQRGENKGGGSPQGVPMPQPAGNEPALPDLSTLPDLDDTADFPAPPPPTRKAWVWALGVLMLILAAGAGGMFLFPEYGELAMKEVNSFFPGLATFIAPEPPPPAVGPAMVKIVDVKQRFINNNTLGNMRIVEGVAMNASPHPMTRIKIRGELIDMVGALVKVGAAFCGNLLTDEELVIMSEEQIFRELANPQGTDFSNDRIAPQGTIPFMLVFIGEPAGVTKTLVMPVAAERLISP